MKSLILIGQNVLVTAALRVVHLQNKVKVYINVICSAVTVSIVIANIALHGVVLGYNLYIHILD